MRCPPPRAQSDALTRLQGLCRFGVKPGLERTRRALEVLGDPQRGFPMIHLAGTNGKGSTAAMIASCLRHVGLRVGLFTSPHLQRFSERFTVDGQEIRLTDLEVLIDRVIDLDLGLTFFEVATVVALAHFAEQRVSCAVIETGLGGRLDATNVIIPTVTVLTSIAHDHADVLGHDLCSIAREKAGILKPGVPAVVAWPAEADVRAVIDGRAVAVGASVEWIDDAAVEARLEDLEVGLRGSHQRLNAALALAAAERYLERRGEDTPREELGRGLAEVRWAGRLEQLADFLLDCAHNPAGAASLATSVAATGEGPYVLVFGCLDDKPALSLLEPLLPHCGAVVLAPIDNPRGADPARVQAELAQRAPGLPITLAADVAGALATARRDPRPKLVAGSVYLVGEARGLLVGGEEGERDPEALVDPVARP